MILERLRDYKATHDLADAAIAKALDLSQPTVSSWLRGIRPLKDKYIPAIERLLNASPPKDIIMPAKKDQEQGCTKADVKDDAKGAQQPEATNAELPATTTPDVPPTIVAADNTKPDLPRRERSPALQGDFNVQLVAQIRREIDRNLEPLVQTLKAAIELTDGQSQIIDALRLVNDELVRRAQVCEKQFNDLSETVDYLVSANVKLIRKIDTGRHCSTLPSLRKSPIERLIADANDSNGS